MKIILSWAEWQDQDEEVETAKEAFVELVQTLLDDKYEKDKFLKVSSSASVFSFCPSLFKLFHM